MDNFESDDVAEDRPYRLAALELADLFDDGDIVPKEWLWARAGIEESDYERLARDLTPDALVERIKADQQRDAFAYLAFVDGLRRELLVIHQIALDNVRGKGYRRVKPHEQTGLAMDHFRTEVSSASRKCRDVLVNVRVTLLDDEERRRNLEAQGKLSQLAAMGRRVLGSRPGVSYE